ncbi:MAG: potassium-transporting ATPase subunit KdpA [Gammaproteobacteria bacterium]
MTGQGWFSLLLFLAVLGALSYPLGIYMARIADAAPLGGLLGKLERAIYRVSGVDPAHDMPWTRYAVSVLSFNALGVVVVYLVQRLQLWLPLNPQGMANVPADSAFDTAVSFVTNTNWQGYAGESTLSYLTQMLALTGQNFFSAATGIAVAFALMRGFARRSAQGIGNFWVDLTRTTLYLLLPLSLVLATIFMGQGVIQNFKAYQAVSSLESVTYAQPKLDAAGQPLKDPQGNPLTETLTAHTQTLAMGPVASQEAIKMLGTNGGGFFNSNSAHPFENPTPLTNFLQMIAMFLIPAALCFTFGRMVGDSRQGWAVFSAMTAIFVVMAVVAMWAEGQGNPLLTPLGVDQAHSALQAGGNMEGKESRFGIVASALFATITTSASCGAVNAMHDSFTPLGGMVPMWLIQLGEVVFGGVGSGLYGMLIFAIMAVFVAGLMIGRTPEYIGKKIESFEMKMTSVVILVTPFLVLVGTAVAVMVESGRLGIFNPGAHGFSEVLYALSSASNNNGSAFAGLSANTPFYNTLLAIAMWFGRFAFIVPVLAIAGSLAKKKRIEATAGTLPTHGALFVALLVGTVVLVGALTYVPALALGPVIEHLQLHAIH